MKNFKDTLRFFEVLLLLWGYISSIFSDERSHRLYNHLRIGYGGYIDPTYITNVLSEYDNIDITIVRPYRNINGIITQKSTDNLEDYYVIPKYMSLAMANIATDQREDC